MNKIKSEFENFMSYPLQMRVLIATNAIYALVLPIIEMFVSAYVMRNSNDVKMVVVYQLAVYTGIPLTFFVNGWLLRHFPIKRLYSVGMLLSGVSMVMMMSLGSDLSIVSLCGVGIVMGMSFGLYWSNRDFLALSSTSDGNRNYYYGVENFILTLAYIVVPGCVGAFIEASKDISIIGSSNKGYQVVTGVVFILTCISSYVIHQAPYKNPPNSPFIYFRFHQIWKKMQGVAFFKGLMAGYVVTAPSMLILTLIGQEGALGLIQTIGGLISAVALYFIGRFTKPEHRIAIFAVGAGLFALSTVPNAILYDKVGVIIFMIGLTLSRPLWDLAFFSIQMLAINTISHLEKRNEFAYILSQEFGFYLGRMLGCVIFLVLAYEFSKEFALRYALLAVGLIQLIVIFFAKSVVDGCNKVKTQANTNE